MDVRTDLIQGIPKQRYLTGNGKPTAIILHETANQTSTLQNEIDYVKRNWNNAFFHYIVDHSQAVNLADSNYIAWGAGPMGNAFGIHIELVRDNGKNFRQAYDNYLSLAVQVAKSFNMPMKFNQGKEGFVTHNWVSKNLGGTDHTDPDSWLNQNGISIDQFGRDLKSKYDGSNDMPINIKYVDMVLKMGLRREPTKEELNNKAYQDNPELLIDTVWNNGGKASYDDRGNEKSEFTEVQEKLYRRK